MVFCRWCKEMVEEDEICENKICNYLKNKLNDVGLFQFYLRCYSALEKK